MESGERKELVEAIVLALDERHAGEGGRLLELMRAEQNLMDALAVIRREIDVIVRAAN